MTVLVVSRGGGEKTHFLVGSNIKLEPLVGSHSSRYGSLVDWQQAESVWSIFRRPRNMWYVFAGGAR